MTDKKLDSKSRRRITQQVGARVSEGGEVGHVTGHYDDDSVYVLFEGSSEPARVWVDALTLLEE